MPMEPRALVDRTATTVKPIDPKGAGADVVLTPAGVQTPERPTQSLSCTEKVGAAARWVKEWALGHIGWIAWALSVLLGANHSIVQVWANYSPITKTSSETRYHAPVAFAALSAMTTTASIIATLLWDGLEGLKQMFQWETLLRVAPGALGLTAADLGCAAALHAISPTMMGVIGQSRLILTSLVCATALRRRITATEWTLCLALTSAVLAFTLLTPGQKDFRVALQGIVFAGLFVFGSVFYATWTDNIAKRHTIPAHHLVGQLRLVTLLFESVGAIGYLLYHQYPLANTFAGSDGP